MNRVEEFAQRISFVFVLFVSGYGNDIDDGGPVAFNVRLEERAVEGYHVDSRGVDGDLALFDLNDLVVLELLQQARKLLNSVEGVLEIVLVAQQGNDKLGLLVDSLEGNSLLEAELLAERCERAPDEGFRHKRVGKSVTVVGKHKNLLELVTSANRELKDVLFGL